MKEMKSVVTIEVRGAAWRIKRLGEDNALE